MSAAVRSSAKAALKATLPATLASEKAGRTEAAASTSDLSPKEYLSWLQAIESGLPKGTRAYLVSLTDDGRRQLWPVADGATVLDLQKELPDRITGLMVPDPDWLIRVRDACDAQLKRHKVDTRSVAVQQAGYLVDECAQLASGIQQLAIIGLDDNPPNALACIQRLSGQLGWVADLAAQKLGYGMALGGAEAWMCSPAFHNAAKDAAKAAEQP